MDQGVWERLAEPFDPNDIDWRVGNHTKDKTKATLLAYLTARAVMDRLDAVVGAANWSDSYTPIVEDSRTVGYMCTLSIRVGDEWVSKTDVADTSDIEAIKGGVSGALKRAAVKWGIGRYLYDLDGRRFYTIKEGYGPNQGAVFCPLGEQRKPGHILIPQLPTWAVPKVKPPVRELAKPVDDDDAPPPPPAPAAPPPPPEPQQPTPNAPSGEALEPARRSFHRAFFDKWNKAFPEPRLKDGLSQEEVDEGKERVKNWRIYVMQAWFKVSSINDIPGEKLAKLEKWIRDMPQDKFQAQAWKVINVESPQGAE